MLGSFTNWIAVYWTASSRVRYVAPAAHQTREKYINADHIWALNNVAKFAAEKYARPEHKYSIIYKNSLVYNVYWIL